MSAWWAQRVWARELASSSGFIRILLPTQPAAAANRHYSLPPRPPSPHAPAMRSMAAAECSTGMDVRLMTLVKMTASRRLQVPEAHSGSSRPL